MGWWFGRKDAPADVRPFVPAWLTTVGDGEGFARSYAEQVDEVYRRNPVGQRSVRLVAEMLGQLTVDCQGDPAAVAMVRREGLLEGIAANLLLHGNAYVQLLSEGGDKPSELVTLRLERVSVVSDERGYPTGYLYRAGERAAKIAKLDALGRRQVAHLKGLNPRDDHYGMGCVEAATAAATAHNRAAKWNKALSTADGSGPIGEQFDRLKDELARNFSDRSTRAGPCCLKAASSGRR